MTTVGFDASADLIGRRILLSWTVVPDANGGLARVSVHRKARDFDFPAAAAPYLVYDSAAFPPPESAEVAVRRLPGAVDLVEGLRRTTETISVARPDGARMREVLRRTIYTFTRADHSLVRQEVELLDAGTAAPLEPGRTCYYRLESAAAPPEVLRVSATPGGVYHYHRTLYEAIPEVYRRGDTVTRPVDEGTGWFPEAGAAGGQLQRLVDVFGMAVGALRGGADGLRGLRDTARTDAKYLPLLAQWIGWEPGGDDIAGVRGEVARLRGEIAAAPQRYRTAGTIAGIAELVTHYTGWTARISEAAQQLAHTNSPPQRNPHAAVERADGSWTGSADAAVPLGLAGATGTQVTAAAGPYALAEGMRLRVAVDGAPPVVLRLSAADFARIGAATAAEMAAVVARGVPGVSANVVGGKLRIASVRTTAEARVAVSAAAASLFTLDGAPRGRLATALDGTGVHWVAYATTCAADAPAAHLRVLARRSERWYDARPIGGDGFETGTASRPESDPALVALPGGRLWCAWISDPATDHSMPYFRIGVPEPPIPARLRAELPAPFRLVPGATVTFTGSVAAQRFTVRAQDYANPAAATAAEVAAAMNAQLAGLRAVDLHGLVLETVAAGPEATLRVDLAASTGAWALGLGNREAIGRGSWDAAVDWGPPRRVVPAPAGHSADCAALVEGDGAVRLCWSHHDAGSWRLITARWTGRMLVSTRTGLNIVTPEGISTLTTAQGLPANDIRDAVTDVEGTTWFATTAGLAARNTAGAVTTFTKATTAGGLVSDTLRGVAISPDGSIWVATAGGVSRRDPVGAWTAFTAAQGLPADDIRAIAVGLDGSVWAGTPTGIAVRRADRWTTLRAANRPEVRRILIAPDRAVWVATATGVLRISGGDLVADDLTDLAPGATDVRDLTADGGTVWAATGAGVVEIRDARRRILHGSAAGIADPNCRAIVATGDEIWVATANGAFGRGSGGRWSPRNVGPGSVVALSEPWSALELAADSAAGEREPHLARAGTTVLLAAARRHRTATGGTWQLTLRRRAAGGATWSAVTALTPVGAQDREPVLAPAADGSIRVYFRSDRGGGERIWRVQVSAAGIVSAPVAVTTGPASDTDPAVLPDAAPPTLLFRSDRNVAPAALANQATGAAAPEISVRRYAGTRTVNIDDTARNTAAGTFGDLLAYTPQRPRGDAPAPGERYLPSTVTIHVGPGHTGTAVGTADARRLDRLLAGFVAAQVRIAGIPDR
ncbi:phage tail protein [Nocardia goodfellowii]|uniref:Phage tail-like protein n=1 Tax=Nocardia goodfellowii TaxID=882446 RepID=A0ABS4QMM4_9NOCA|nr:phage tail protein [Nocardia goodfellowii]MBP2192961.1 phage tail-like protein [Nocardia goodfellowii]